MIKIGDKEYRNLVEQVEKNKSDIQFIINEEGTLNQFGLKVVEVVEDVSDIPSVSDYKEDHEDWAYGDTFIVGTEEPWELYILTRANNQNPSDYWFNIGEFPLPGPQGEQGEQGIPGQDGINGTNGTNAGFGAPVVDNSEANNVGTASVQIAASGPDTAKVFSFKFSNLKGQTGETGPQGPVGRVGPFLGHVNDVSDLPAASSVPDNGFYTVGSTTPYDIYAKTIYNTWSNMGPATQMLINTYNIDTDATHTSGTVTPSLMLDLNNDTGFHTVSIGNDLSNTKYFYLYSKNSSSLTYINFNTNWYDLNNQYVYAYLGIDRATGAWSISNVQQKYNYQLSAADADSGTISADLLSEIKDAYLPHTISIGDTSYVLFDKTGGYNGYNYYSLNYINKPTGYNNKYNLYSTVIYLDKSTGNWNRVKSNDRKRCIEISISDNNSNNLNLKLEAYDMDVSVGDTTVTLMDYVNYISGSSGSLFYGVNLIELIGNCISVEYRTYNVLSIKYRLSHSDVVVVYYDNANQTLEEVTIDVVGYYGTVRYIY